MKKGEALQPFPFLIVVNKSNASGSFFDFVHQVVHFLTAQLDAFFTKGLCYFCTCIFTTFWCEEHTTCCADDSSAEECSNEIQTFHDIRFLEVTHLRLRTFVLPACSVLRL